LLKIDGGLEMPTNLAKPILIRITDISEAGEGIGRHDNRVVFVPSAVPEDTVEVQLVNTKTNYANAKLCQIIKPSPHRVQPQCIVADKCGGCQWQLLSYGQQLTLKQKKVQESLVRIGKFDLEYIVSVLQPIARAEHPFGYRNKVAFPLGTSETGQVKAGYFQRNSHKLINLNQCPVQDQRLNIFLQNIKQDIQQRGWQIYDEHKHQGILRHLILRVGRYTGEVLLGLVATAMQISGLYDQAQQWLNAYVNLVGVVLNHQPQKNNVILGTETKCIAGRDYLVEKLLGYTFHLRADTFFQVNTEQAEKMIQFLIENLALSQEQILLDAYAGIGAIAICLAKYVQRAIAIEVQPQATVQGLANAQLNQINNIEFLTGKVEQVLPELHSRGVQPNIVILDPPRKGCQTQLITALRAFPPHQIAYVSCNPATLARDLQLLCAEGLFQLQKLQPFDFFPQTAHVECVAILCRQ
jgi:23S rRNA (uracil-5-)-methyltransferase RumA (EC 2.1.1.-)